MTDDLKKLVALLLLLVESGECECHYKDIEGNWHKDSSKYPCYTCKLQRQYAEVPEATLSELRSLIKQQ